MFKKVHIFRVMPKQELYQAILDYCRENEVYSGLVIGIIGSLERVRLNFIKALPGKYEGADYAGPLEIVCGQGSIALKDNELVAHIHLQVSSRELCRGGHLVAATVFSTAEVAIGELEEQLQRRYDPFTGLNELA